MPSGLELKAKQIVTQGFQDAFRSLYKDQFPIRMKHTIGTSLAEGLFCNHVPEELTSTMHTLPPTPGELANAQTVATTTPLELGILLDRFYPMQPLIGLTMQRFPKMPACRDSDRVGSCVSNKNGEKGCWLFSPIDAGPG